MHESVQLPSWSPQGSRILTMKIFSIIGILLSALLAGCAPAPPQRAQAAATRVFEAVRKETPTDAQDAIKQILTIIKSEHLFSNNRIVTINESMPSAIDNSSIYVSTMKRASNSHIDYFIALPMDSYDDGAYRVSTNFDFHLLLRQSGVQDVFQRWQKDALPAK